MKYNVVLSESTVNDQTITYLDKLTLNNKNYYPNINLCIPNGPTDKYEVSKDGIYYNDGNREQLDKKVTLVPIIVGGIGPAQGQSQEWWQGEKYYCQCGRELRTGDLVVLKANSSNLGNIVVGNINNSTVIRKIVNYTDSTNYLGYVFTISSGISIKALRSALLLYVYDLQTGTPVMKDNVKVVECRCVVIASGRAGEIRST